MGPAVCSAGLARRSPQARGRFGALAGHFGRTTQPQPPAIAGMSDRETGP